MVIRYASAEPTRRPASAALYAESMLSSRIRLGDLVSGVAGSLKRRSFRMALAAALPLAAAFAYVQIQPARYQTAASVFVDPQLSRPGRPDAPDGGVIAGQLRLASSRTVLQRAIEREKFVEDPTFEARPTGALALAKALAGMVRGTSDSPAADRPAAVLNLLSQSVQARNGEGANLIDVSASASDPIIAMRIANAVAQSFVDELMATADTAQGSERTRLAKRGDELKARLRDAEAKLAAYRSQNGFDTAASRSPQADMDGPTQLARARAATLEAKAKSDQIQKLLASGKEAEAIADLVRSPSIDRLRIQYNEASAQEASFRTSLGPRHPAYLDAAQQAKEKKRLLLEGLRLAGASARADWQAAREQEAALESRGGAAVVPQPATPTLMLQDLERNVEIARAAYDRYVRSFESPETGAQSVAARVVAQASLPVAPVSGNTGHVWGLAGLTALAFAGFIGIAGILRDIASPPAARARTVRKAPASAPAPAPARQENQREGQRENQPQPAASPVRIRPMRSEEPPAVRQPPQGRAAPAGVVERLALEIAQRSDGFPLQTVLVTVASGDCAKADLSLELAREMRKLGLRILMLDVDEADPALSTQFAQWPVAGAVTIQGRNRAAFAVDPGLPGACCLIPVESLSSPVSGRLIGGIAGNFDVVILVGPAMGGTIAERKLARASQFVLVGHGNERPGQIRIAETLGVATETIRLAHAAAPDLNQETPARPMSIVRTKKCA